MRAALDSPPAALVRAVAGDTRRAAVAEMARRLAAAGERTLLLAPEAGAAAEVVAALAGDPAVRPRPAEPEPSGQEELKRLRWELLWLEQWPRDRAKLVEARATSERRRGALGAEEERLAAAVEAVRAQIETARQHAGQHRERLDALAAERQRATAEAAEARAAWQELQAAADTAARQADEGTRAAEAVHARSRALGEHVVRCERELRAAREREATLTEQLAHARQAIPAADRETAELADKATEAEAAQHASYYRLRAAESALGAERRNMTLTQRLHMAPGPAGLGDLRHQVKARAREAEQTAEQAQKAMAAHQEAAAQRAALDKFVADSERELAAARDAQARLTAEIATKGAERDEAAAEHAQRAREAAAAVDQATKAVTAARESANLSTVAEEHAATAQRAQQEAAAALEHIEAELAVATDRLAAGERELAGHRQAAERERADLAAELGAYEQAEQRARRHVRQICNLAPEGASDGDPDSGLGGDSDGVLDGHRAKAMKRAVEGIERLTAELAEANLVHGTAAGLAAGPYGQGDPFDTLVVLDADRLADPPFLVGAVRSRRWILIADGSGRPPRQAGPAATEPRSVFERAAAAAPSLCHELPD